MSDHQTTDPGRGPSLGRRNLLKATVVAGGLAAGGGVGIAQAQTVTITVR